MMLESCASVMVWSGENCLPWHAGCLGFDSWVGHKKSPVARFYVKVTSSYFDVREEQWRHSQNEQILIIGDAVIPTNHCTEDVTH